MDLRLLGERDSRTRRCSLRRTTGSTRCAATRRCTPSSELVCASADSAGVVTPIARGSASLLAPLVVADERVLVAQLVAFLRREVVEVSRDRWRGLRIDRTPALLILKWL